MARAHRAHRGASETISRKPIRGTSRVLGNPGGSARPQRPQKPATGWHHYRPPHSNMGMVTGDKPSPTNTLVVASHHAPPKPPGQSALPVDPNAALAQLQALRQLGLAQTNYQYGVGQLQHQYGYTSSGQIDPGNPFSLAALLQTNYNNTTRGTGNSYAAMGQYHSGAYQTAQTNNQRNYAIGDNNLRERYGQSLQGLRQNLLQSYAQYGSSLSQANWQSLLRALGS